MKRQLLQLAVAGSLVLVASSGASAQQVSGIMIEGFGWGRRPPPNRAWWDNLSDKARPAPRPRDHGIWAPPATKAAGGGFSDGYDLYDYYDLGSKNQMGTVATKWGTKEQYLEFIGVAHANGMDVYADVVCNQRCGGAAAAAYDSDRQPRRGRGRGPVHDGPVGLPPVELAGRLERVDGRHARRGPGEPGHAAEPLQLDPVVRPADRRRRLPARRGEEHALRLPGGLHVSVPGGHGPEP